MNVSGVRRERKNIQLVVANQTALTITQRQHETLVETSDNVSRAFRAEPGKIRGARSVDETEVGEGRGGSLVPA